MDAYALMLPLLLEFVNCFSKPGFKHFKFIIMAHMVLLGIPHCMTETMRLTKVHQIMHWTTPYAFMRKGRWSCRKVSQRLLEIIAIRLKIVDEMIIAIDDTLVKKWGKRFFGLGFYRDPTDKNPGAHTRKVRGHCWVVAAMLWEYGPGRWLCFPLAALLFVPQTACQEDWEFMTKIELAVMIMGRLRWSARRLVLVVDNLYAKASLAGLYIENAGVVLVSRLRSNAALYDPPKQPKAKKRGRPRIRGKKIGAGQLYRRKSKRRKLTVNIYGKTVVIDAFVGVVIPSRTLGRDPILVLIFPQRSGKKMNIFFTTDLHMDPVRLLEIYAARFKIEALFRELKTSGGFADCRQRSFTAIKRHATLCLVAYSLLQLVSATLTGAEHIEAEPWWRPTGPPSVTRLRRAVFKAFRISCSLHSDTKVKKIIPLKKAA